MLARQDDEAAIWLSTTPATPLQRRQTLTVMGLLLVVNIVVVPLASVRLPEIQPFIPIIQAIIFVADFVTAVLLFTKFALIHSRALLVLASGYLFTTFIIIPHTLTFPGLFAPDGLLGAGFQTTAWLYVIWHLGYPTAVIGYAALKDTPAPKDATQLSALSSIFWSVAIVIGLVCAITWGATAGDKHLPRLFLDRTTYAPLVFYVGLVSAIVCGLAFFLLWTRQRSVLDQWLLIAVFAALLELGTVTFFSIGRFDVGWYWVRFLGVISSTVLLIGLLTQTTTLYAKLALTTRALKRERDSGLVNIEAVLASVAHEVKQPLTTVAMSAAAARRWLQREPPDVAEARQLINETERAGLLTSEVFDNIRGLFRGADQGQPINLNELVLEVRGALSRELQSHGISTSEQLLAELPLINGHKGQLREVLLNLVQNAIDAMGTVADRPRKLRLETAQDEDKKIIIITIEDSGPGIDPQKMASIFDRYFTTKEHGIGLGLAISRMIIDHHAGKILVSSNPGHGTQFRIVLPISET
jgi:signal transduction histidine kinase